VRGGNLFLCAASSFRWRFLAAAFLRLRTAVGFS